MAAKIVSIMLLLSLLVGCATSPTQTYRPAGYTGPAWTIEGNMKMGLVDNTVIVRINGTEVINGKFSDFSNTAEFSGQYKGQNVNASCTRMTGYGSYQVQCIVFVDNERAATLQF